MRQLLLAAVALCLGACAAIAPPASASAANAQQASEEASPLDSRVSGLVALLAGEAKPEDYFADSFLAAVPPAQFSQISDSLIAQYGKPVSAAITKRLSANSAEVAVTFEKAVANVKIVIEAAAPHKVSGLLITNVEVTGDNADKIDADFKALPGKAGYIVAKLGDGAATQIVAGANVGEQFAIGSTFKLYILAQLASEIDAGKRNWSDVAPLAHRSFSSSGTRRWPTDAPMTLQSLASMMISLSDNSATDTLLHLLGREQVEAKLAAIGHSAPDRTLPFLSTVEAFAIKSSDDLHTKFSGASEAQQRKILKNSADKLGFDNVDNSAFAAGPRFIDTIEWFASPADLVGLLNHLRNTRNGKMMEIMAINTGIGEADAKKWKYLGYKGGSEPGVISMSYLAQSKAGTWYAISASWNNPEKEVSTIKMVELMTRLLNSAADK